MPGFVWVGNRLHAQDFVFLANGIEPDQSVVDISVQSSICSPLRYESAYMVGWLTSAAEPHGPVGLEAERLPDLKSIQSIYLVLGFIVPGMIIAFVRAQFLTGRLRTLSESIVTYIALTVLYYGLAAPFVEYVLSFEEPGRAKIAAWLALIVVVPAIVGLVLGALAQNDVFRRLLQWLRINPVHVTPAAWDYTFARLRGDHFVMVTLSDGSTVGGIYGSHSFASSDPTERDLFLQEIYDVDGGSWSKRSERQAILIPSKEIKHVQIWSPKGT